MPWNCSYLSVSRFFSPTEQLKVGRQEQKHPLNSPFHGEEEPPQRMIDLTVGLCPEKLGRRDAGYLFEEAGEVVWKLEAKQQCGFADVVAVHQEALALFYNERMDVTDSRTAGGFVDYVAQVPGRISHLLRAVFQNKAYVSQNDVPQRLGIIIFLKFVP